MSDVRADCSARYGDTPCILIVRSDGLPDEAHDCAQWCPLLRRSIEEPCHQMATTILQA